MKAEELRIGNTVYDRKGKVITVDDIIITQLAGWNNSKYAKKPPCNPIPLTDKWLEKFGFKVCHGITGSGKAVYADFGSKFQSLRIYLADESVQLPCSIHIDFTDWFPKIVELSYVHQLQNLYFALTGEELTIKDK